MTDKATHMEARLMGLSKRRSKDGDWFEIKLQVHPENMPNELYGVDLGTRMGIAMVQIGDDEQPEKQPEKPERHWDDLPPSQQAGIRCRDKAFQAWIQDQGRNAGFVWPVDSALSEVAAIIVRRICCIDTRGELNINDRAANQWRELNAQYEASQHTERRG